MKKNLVFLVPLLATILLAILAALNVTYGLERSVAGFALVLGMIGWALLAAMVKRQQA